MRTQLGSSALLTGRPARPSMRLPHGPRLRPFSTSSVLLRLGGASKHSKHRKERPNILHDLENFRPENNLWKDLKGGHSRGGILAWKPETSMMDQTTREKLAATPRRMSLGKGFETLKRNFEAELELEKGVELLGNPSSIRYTLKKEEMGIVLEHFANAQQEMDEAAMDLGAEFQEQTGLSTADLATFDAEFQEGTTSERRMEPGDLVEVRWVDWAREEEGED